MNVGMSRLTALALVLAGLATGTPAASARQSQAWLQLFNGRDLEGWTPKITGYEAGVNFGNTFRVEGGVLDPSVEENDG